MVNADGLKVMGFMADENGKITSKMGEISVDRTVVDAKATDKVELFMNLDVREAKVQFDPKRPNETSAFSTGVTVYDSVGNAHVITVFFNKADDNKWEWHAMAKGEEIQGGKPGELVEGAKGTLTFDGQGRLLEQKIDKSAFSFTNGAKPDQRVEFSFGKDIKSGGDGLQITQYGTSSQAYKTVQNGFTAGSLAGLSFNDDGILSAVYDNGISLNLAQVALAKFENPEGLFKMGQNRYRESRNSGQATIGGPGQAGRGTVSSKTLEASTTDIANEFINLMTSQRTFQANSKVISSADEMLQDVLNIKHR
jgi:flagellar hook protein FlgE